MTLDEVFGQVLGQHQEALTLRVGYLLILLSIEKTIHSLDVVLLPSLGLDVLHRKAITFLLVTRATGTDLIRHGVIEED